MALPEHHPLAELPRVNGSSSSLVDALGCLARSLSGSARVHAEQAGVGLELTSTSSGGYGTVPEAPQPPASQPMPIPGTPEAALARACSPFDAAASGQLALPPGKAEALSLAGPSVPALAPPAAAGAAAAAAAAAAATQPIPLRHPLEAVFSTGPLPRTSSGGSSGLPCALALPSPAPDACGPANAASHSAQVKQEPPPLQAESSASKVRWLPGLLTSSRASSTKQAESSLNSSTQQSLAATPGSLPLAVVPPPATGGEQQQPSADAPRSSRLPPSGNDALDRYLRYLLREPHNHKFLHYPEWGLSEEACLSVAEFLRRDKRIKVVNLAHNHITDDGAELIAEALTANNTLLSLDLSGNCIGNMGALALAEALHANRTLTDLQLGHNRVGDEGAEALAAAIAASSSLKKLGLAGNSVSAAQLQVVEAVLKTRSYKLPKRQPSSGRGFKAHMRKSSSLQFCLELSEGDGVREGTQRLQLDPATVVRVLSEAKPDCAIESSLALQAHHLLAELQGKQDAPAALPVQQHADGDGSAGGEPPPLDASVLPLLGLRLAWRGYEVALRTSCPTIYEPGSAAHSSGLANKPEDKAAPGMALGLKHSFVRVTQPGDESAPPVILDPFFREQFAIPHCTDRYRAVLAALPRVLTVSEPRLFHLVEALCRETEKALSASGLSLPPWRSADAMMARWLSDNASDIPVEDGSVLADLHAQLAAGLVGTAGGAASSGSPS